MRTSGIAIARLSSSNRATGGSPPVSPGGVSTGPERGRLRSPCVARPSQDRDQGRVRRMSGPRALLVVDVQRGFEDPALGPRDNPQAEENVAKLIAAWRGRGDPIVVIQH